MFKSNSHQSVTTQTDENRDQGIKLLPGTTQMAHMQENIGADGVKFSVEEWQQFNKELDAIQIIGERLPEFVLQFSKVEATIKH